jgi:hypothetical protein
VVAEWLGSGRKGTATEGSDPAAARERLLDAAKAAQRAVDDRTVPRRFDRLIREFFRRVPQEMGLEEPGANGAPPR